MKIVTTLLASALLTACASGPPPLLPPEMDVRPVTQKDDLQGRWVVTAIDGRPSQGLWLELGAEGPPAIERRADGGINFGRPGQPTRAYLGCNWLTLNGWTRNGDKLSLGIDGSRMTERGCAEGVMRTETQAEAILRLAMTMELSPPSRLRLINEAGSIDLVRQGS